MTKRSVDIEQWDRYWAYGNLHSFSQACGGNYHGVLADFWRARFARLAPGSRVLDIATGNGAIALLALEESDRLSRRLEVAGTDLADIDPGTRVGDPALLGGLRRIDFHGRTPAESLPFADGTIDMACSQFGLEYSDLSRAAPEACRVLAPGGGIAIVAHHADSVLLAATRSELDQLSFVLDEARLYLRARNLLKAMADTGKGKTAKRGGSSPKVEKKQRGLREAVQMVENKAATVADSHMLLGPVQYIREIFSATDRAAPGELLQWLEEALARVTANQRRLLDMTAAARGNDDLSRLLGLLDENGLVDIDHGPLHQEDGGLLGWRIEARKSA